jgi:hypothetical protein
MILMATGANLHPIGAPPRPLRPIPELGHNAFQSHEAGVLERKYAVAVQVVGKPKARSSSLQKRSQRPPAGLPVVLPQILAVDLHQVEGAQEGLGRALAAKARAHPIELRLAVRTADDAFAIEHCRARGGAP